MPNNMEEEQKKFYKIIEKYLDGLENSGNNAERQRDAVIKMTFLKEKDFHELLMDVCDEILRRQKRDLPFLEKSPNFSEKRNSSRKKLSRLEEIKFRNLLLDIYLVYNHRFLGFEDKNTKEIETLIEEFELLKKQLKGELEYEQMIIKTIEEECDIKMKMHIYNKYVKRILDKHNEDLVVVNYVEIMISTIFNDVKISLEELLKPQNFLNKADIYFENNDKYVDEYTHHKTNMRNLIENNEYEHELKNKLIGKEIANIIDIIYTSMNKESPSIVQSIEGEITLIIQNLESIKIAIQEKKEMEEYYKIAESVLDVSHSLLEKLKNIENLDSVLVDKLVNEKNDLKNCVENNRFDRIPVTIFNMANMVKTILYCIPVNDLK